MIDKDNRPARDTTPLAEGSASLCLRRNYRRASAVVTLFCGVLWMTGCGVSKNTASPVGAATGSAMVPENIVSMSFPEEGGTIASIPSTYVQGVPNRWVLYFHGYNQDASTILSGYYGDVEAALLNAGYIVIGMTNTTQNCFGDAQCSADVAAVAKLYKSKLSLQPEPYVLANSSGGFTALNAISAGAIQPKAVVGWCINTDLEWDYVDGGAVKPITVDYHISSANPYDVATAGYDPMLQKGAVYAATPFELWASYSDTVVQRAANADRFAAMVNASGGKVEVNTSTGGHLDASNFDPVAVTAFFNAN